MKQSELRKIIREQLSSLIEGELNEGKRRTIQFPIRAHGQMKALLKNLKPRRDYDFGVGSRGMVLLDIDVKYLDQLASVLNNSHIKWEIVEGKTNEGYLGAGLHNTKLTADLLKIAMKGAKQAGLSSSEVKEYLKYLADGWSSYDRSVLDFRGWKAKDFANHAKSKDRKMPKYRSWSGVQSRSTSTGFNEGKLNEADLKTYSDKELLALYQSSKKSTFPNKAYIKYLEKEFKRRKLKFEAKVTEALARGLKPLLTIGSKITKKVGEDALVKLSDKFERIVVDDEYIAGDIASHLDMAIELMQDGYPGDATKKLKQFNKACKDVLRGKSIKSAFAEGKLNEAKLNKKDIAYQLKIDYSGNTPPKIVKLTNREISIFYGYKINPKDVINSIQKLEPVELKHKKWSNISSGGGVHTFTYDLQEGKLTESMIGIETKADFKPNSLKGALEKAGIKGFKMDRLTWSLSMLKLDKKDLENAKKIIDTLPKAKIKMVKEGKLNEMDINDPILIAVRARKQTLAKEKAAPKGKKISTKQYYKLMDAEIDLINQMKEAAKEYEQLDSDMNAEAGQKGANWSDDDANRYGGDLDKLQTKIEKLAKQKLAVKKQIMNYRIN